MSSAPLISIITVCYNSDQTIEETILSVINQDYPAIEYIIIDGGSTDKTLDIIQKHENRISFWQSEPDKNMYDALNKGLKRVTGSLWMALNSDDYLANTKVLSTVASSYAKFGNQYGAYYGDILKKEVDTFRKISLFPVNYKLLLASEHCSFMPQPSTFLIKEVIAQVGSFDLEYRYASDYDYFLRVTNTYKVKHVSSVTTVFRDHEASITNRLAEKMNEERLRIIGHYQKQTPIALSFLYKYLSWGYYLIINKRFPLKKLFKRLSLPKA